MWRSVTNLALLTSAHAKGTWSVSQNQGLLRWLIKTSFALWREKGYYGCEWSTVVVVCGVCMCVFWKHSDCLFFYRPCGSSLSYMCLKMLFSCVLNWGTGTLPCNLGLQKINKCNDIFVTCVWCYMCTLVCYIFSCLMHMKTGMGAIFLSRYGDVCSLPCM